MTVWFVGAGPGAADLLTLRAHRLITTADVIVVAGTLVDPAVLADARPGARIVDSGALDLDELTALFVAEDATGRDVVRVHSGDPSLYSAVGEQARRLDALGVPWEIVPGVPAFAAAAAALRTELTLPGVGQSLVITRTSARSSPMPAGEELAAFAATGTTLAIHLAAAHAGRIVDELVGAYGPDCPAAVVAWASRPEEQVVRCRLADLVAACAEHGITRTAVIFVGPVLGARDFDESFLYSPTRPRKLDGTTG